MAKLREIVELAIDQGVISGEIQEPYAVVLIVDYDRSIIACPVLQEVIEEPHVMDDVIRTLVAERRRIRETAL